MIGKKEIVAGKGYDTTVGTGRPQDCRYRICAAIRWLKHLPIKAGVFLIQLWKCPHSDLFERPLKIEIKRQLSIVAAQSPAVRKSPVIAVFEPF